MPQSGHWETVPSGSGLFSVLVPDMPRITDDLLDCVFYLYPTEEAARQGEATGGTGFFVGVPSQVSPGKFYVYGVTNSHVIKEGRSSVVRAKSRTGGHDVIVVPPESWIHHRDGDDIAAFMVSLKPDHGVRFVSQQTWATREKLATYDIGPGDDVCMVGRFVNHDGKQQNLPSLRFGNISMMPSEPILSPRGLLQESYLIECRSLPGFSGAPVFVYGSGVHLGKPRTGLLPFLLLGIDWCHPPKWENVYERDKETQTAQGYCVKSNSGMAGVVPVWKLEELLNEDFFMNIRERHEAEVREKSRSATVSLDVVEAGVPTEFTKEDFENALKKVSRRLRPSPPDEGKSKT